MAKWGTIIIVSACFATPALGVTAAQKCQAGKLKIAGKYDFCRLKAEAKAAKTGDMPDYAKCDETFSDKWGSTELAGAGMCPSTGDETAIQAFITQHTDDLAAALSGDPLPDCNGDLATCASDLSTCNTNFGTCYTDLYGCTSTLTLCNVGIATCGNDLTTANADLATCNGNLTACNGNLGTCNNSLAACVAMPQARRLLTGQTGCYDTIGTAITCAGTGQDGEHHDGLVRGYADNGDGTITDLRTGLMWEKQSDDGSIHDWDITYTWDAALSVFIPALNAGSGFASHTDWRLPNRSELESLADLGRQNPAIDPIFNTGCSPGCTVTTCSCTSTFLHYWTSTSNYWHPSTAWLVYFVDGDVNAFDKTTTYFARAVRDAN